jgi:SPX domain protein involved in polyphosphate accumulation
MRFGQRIAKERWLPWALQYINYELLKQNIKAVLQAPEGVAVQARKDEFARTLDAEIEKVSSCML